MTEALKNDSHCLTTDQLTHNMTILATAQLTAYNGSDKNMPKKLYAPKNSDCYKKN
jgi:hypothetical protein